MGTEVVGHIQPGFEAVRDAFRAGFEETDGWGAALSIWQDGEEVVHLHGGSADPRQRKPWTDETAAVVFSCTKGLMAIIAAQLVQEGKLDYQQKVAHYWPEFAANGKDKITVAEALSHRAGLSAPRRPWSFEDLLDWCKPVNALAEQEPLWPPGSGHAYHAITHGWLVGEILRLASGTRVRDLVQRRLAQPLMADLWVGLPEDKQDRVAHIGCSQALYDLWDAEAAKDSPDQPYWPYRAMTLGNALPAALVTETQGFNDPRLQAVEAPGAGGIATAQALASIWSAVVTPTQGVRLLQDDTLKIATEVMSQGPQVYPAPGPYPAWGKGFQLDSEVRRYLSSASFGHDGAGGQVTFADPERRLGFAFVTNWMVGEGDPRATRIIQALKERF